MSFNSSQYVVSESAGIIQIGVIRSGDLGADTSVVCSATDGSAKSPTEFKYVSAFELNVIIVSFSSDMTSKRKTSV